MSKISIESVEADVISLKINGEIKEIQNQLIQLKELLQNQNVQSIYYADKIYNIGSINEANFGFITGKKAFNQVLTQKIIQSIQAYCLPAEKFMAAVQNKPDWVQHSNISNEAKKIIAYSFVGVIGIQLSKLIAIGKEPLSDNKQRKYLEKSIYIIKRSLDLINFTFLSVLWDKMQEPNVQVDAEHKKTIVHFFDSNFEQSIEQQQKLLTTLCNIFTNNNIAYPFPDFDFVNSAELIADVCSKVMVVQQVLDNDAYDLLDCFTMEQELSRFFECFAFLVQYEMASIKRIGYKQMRHVTPHYLHRFAALGIDSKQNKDKEKVLYTTDTVHTDAVLIYTGTHYETNFNLFPFIIDYNALTLEQGVKICFFQSKDLADDSLEYKCLEDGSIIHLSESDLQGSQIDYNDLMLKKEGQIKLNLDEVVKAFHKARQAILQDEFSFEDDQNLI